MTVLTGRSWFRRRGAPGTTCRSAPFDFTIRPEDVGLVSGPRRRVTGLRRDEVAQPAGASGR
ncbi:hypothetical protein [Amycolatopsis pigmentata]|uniref:Uncharacterized protein n=1 Tax=Amycolatopsis pigmentata TaxID=450801 RepID=A0ABW5FXR9_9PSEU